MQKLIISAFVALGILVPAVAFAQTSTTGLLTVYVQVLNQTGYTSYTYQTYSPSNFSVNVSGQSPSLASFPGSQSGTAVTLLPGSYNVTVTNAVSGFAPTYSVGCNNTINAGQTQTCVITMTPSSTYNPYPTPYPYTYNTQPLTCQTLTPNVALGQNATFTAVGGQGGTYNWATAYQNYPNSGPSLTVSFNSSGSQVVTVTNAAQTATCTVNVSNTYVAPVNTGSYYTGYPSYNTGYPNYGTTYPTYGTSPSYTSYPVYTSYPQLPRTGFGPHDLSTGVAFAAVLLIAFGLIATPYVRKTATALSH